MLARWAVVLCILGACGDNLHQQLEPACLLGDEYASIEPVGFSGDGTYIAFWADSNDLRVTTAECGAASEKVWSGVVHASFCGDALLAFTTPYTDNLAPALIGWAPGRAPRVLATDVDPTATHCAPDGMHFTTEADDVVNDGETLVDLMLFDAPTITPIKTLSLDRPRARFTHDSQSLLVEGMVSGTGTYTLSRLPLSTLTLQMIAPFEHTRFDISKDDQFVVFSRPPQVVRLSLRDATQLVLANDLTDVPGRDHMLGDDDLVAYISGSLLRMVPLTGGPAVTLAPAYSLVEHLPGLIFYSGPAGSSVVTTQGVMHELPGGVIQDRTPERVFVTSTPRYVIDVPSGAMHQVDALFPQVAFWFDGRLAARLPDSSVHLIRPGDEELLPATNSTFVVDSSRRRVAASEGAPMSHLTFLEVR